MKPYWKHHYDILIYILVRDGSYDPANEERTLDRLSRQIRLYMAFHFEHKEFRHPHHRTIEGNIKTELKKKWMIMAYNLRRSLGNADPMSLEESAPNRSTGGMASDFNDALRKPMSLEEGSIHPLWGKDNDSIMNGTYLIFLGYAFYTFIRRLFLSQFFYDSMKRVNAPMRKSVGMIGFGETKKKKVCL